MDVAFDPTVLDGFAEVDDTCDQVVTVTIGGAAYQLHCENDAGHDPPCGGTVWWTE